VPDNAGFVEDTEPFRRELLAHCYRLLGSIQDAEDLVQETYLRAWRSYGGFEGRSSVRTWLYQIATNRCLTELDRRARRVLPSGMGGPEPDPGRYPMDAEPGVSWLQPAPDALVTPETADPAAIVAARDGLRLALIASLQYLPPRQRAILVLRDVLAFPAAEVAPGPTWYWSRPAGPPSPPAWPRPGRSPAGSSSTAWPAATPRSPTGTWSTATNSTSSA
jgi:RNA polymerase sigma-70 factor (ECF subfamily)